MVSSVSSITRAQQGVSENQTTLRNSMSTAAAHPPHTLLLTQPSCPLPKKQKQQKARYGNMGAFYMQGLLHRSQQGQGITGPYSSRNPWPGHYRANCLAPSSQTWETANQPVSIPPRSATLDNTLVYPFTFLQVPVPLASCIIKKLKYIMIINYII